MAIKKCFPYLLILFFTLGVMLFLYTYVDVAYGDTYYHLALANFIKDHGLSRQYEHLAYTVYADTFSDGHFLFHVALIPLTFLPLYWANLIGITLMTSIMLGVFYFILSKEGYSLKWIWTASFLLISWGFLFRMTQLRTIPLGIAFMMLVYYFAYKQRYTPLFITIFLFSWTYYAYPLAIIPAGIVAFYLTLKHKKLVWKPAGVAIAAIIIGTIIFPYFPNNLTFLKIQWLDGQLNIPEIDFINVLNVSINQTTQVGNIYENLPPDPKIFLDHNLYFLILLAFLALFMILLKRWDHPLTLIAAFFLLLTIKTDRTIEYALPFTMLLAAHVFQPVKARHNLALIILLVAFTASTLTIGRFLLPIEVAKQNPEGTDECHVFLSEYAQPGQSVFFVNAAASPFTMYYYPEGKAIGGWALYFMLRHNETLMKEYALINIATAPVYEYFDPHAVLKDHFNASYIYLPEVYEDHFAGKFPMPENEYKVIYDNKACRIIEIL